ncbi:uncharacterized protein TNCV_3095711 [Trichonephila clavipes]|nr:uncharacterized protein TNCV_3095711 [Trichonephila clavipes]
MVYKGRAEVDITLHRFQRQYEQLSQFERARILSMKEPGWSARRVTRQLGRSDCVVVFSDEFRFNLSSDDNRVRVWRLHGERLNPAFVSQRYIAPTASVRVDLVANSSSSLSSYASPTAPDYALPLSEDPDGIFHLLFTEITQILWKSV